MALSARAIPYLVLTELPNPSRSEDKSPYRVSISNDSVLKGGGAIEDAVKVRTSRISKLHLANEPQSPDRVNRNRRKGISLTRVFSLVEHELIGRNNKETQETSRICSFL